MLQYARGFLISETGAKVSHPHWWSTKEFGGLRIAHDPRTRWAANAHVAILGHGVELQSGAATNEGLVEELTLALRTGKIQQTLNRISGRYIVMYQTAGTVHLQSDAIGLRSCFFTSKGDFYAGSHDSLVAKQINAEQSVFGAPRYLTEQKMRVMPGRSTRFENVVSLTPNTQLDMSTRKIHRVYAGEGIARLAVGEASQLIVKDVHAQIPALRAKAPSRLSLSAGLDSRATTAMLKPMVEELEFFTYDIAYKAKNNASKYDTNTAQKLANRFGLKHQILTIESDHVPQPIKSALVEITRKSHSRSVANSYYQNFPDGLHIRSNAFEIGRSYYRAAGYTDTNVDAKGMVDIVSARKSTDPRAVDAFEEFIEVTEFKKVSGIDLLDMFYWEHRMGCWMVPIVNESDIAHDTHIVVNSRQTLEHFLGVDVDSRDSGAVLDQIILDEWPELYEIPVNGKMRELV